MNINYQPNATTNFRATFPVQHWVSEAGGGNYAPVFNSEIVKILERKIVSILNKPLATSSKPMKVSEQNFRAYIGKCDADYRNTAKVRSFYTRDNADIDGYSPVVYMITGEDVTLFEDCLAKNIGKEKSNAKKMFDTTYSHKSMSAIKVYNDKGYNFVNNKDRRIQSQITGTQVLHTKFEAIRNKLGEIKDYIFVDARFLPETGPKSPFVKLGMVKE